MDNLEFCDFTLKGKHMLHPLLNSSILHSTLNLTVKFKQCSSVTTKKLGKKSHTKSLRTVAPAQISPAWQGGDPSTLLTRDWWLSNLQIQGKPSQQLHKALCSPPALELFIFNQTIPILLTVLDFWEDCEECCSPHSNLHGQAGEGPQLLVWRRRLVSGLQQLIALVSPKHQATLKRVTSYEGWYLKGKKATLLWSQIIQHFPVARGQVSILLFDIRKQKKLKHSNLRTAVQCEWKGGENHKPMEITSPRPHFHHSHQRFEEQDF